MRRTARLAIAAFAALGAAIGAGPLAQPARAAEPPHAWLFGSWTGGLFPVNARLTVEACLTQPVVIFTRDVVLRARLTEQLYTQRAVETARAITGGTEFRFLDTQPAVAAGGDLLGLMAPRAPAGFGCENADVLHVARRSENEISFPGCADFPYPLVRCSAR